MSVTLRRHAVVETLSLESQDGIDGQGKPSYGSPVDVSGHVVREIEDLRDLSTRAGSATLRSVATVYVDGCQDNLPEIDDRLTTEDGTLIGIVVQRTAVASISRGLDHIVLKLREV